MASEAGEESAIRGLRHRLWIERVFFALIVAGILAFHFGKLGTRRVCLIAIDGKPAAVVASRSDASRLLDDIKKASGMAGDVSFSHKVTLHSIAAAGQRVLPGAEALGVLSEKLQPVVQASAILVNGELVVGLPDRKEAVQTLSSLLRELSPRVEGVQASFKESVKVETRDVSADHFAATAEEALAKIMKSAAPKGTHEVEPGETGWKIALTHHVPLSRLAAANQGVDLNRIRAGDELKIPGELPPLTVIARRDIREELAPGVSKTVRVTYENGVEVSREVVARERPPTGRRRRPRTSEDVTP
jgi:LysM repeat protein